MDDCFALENIKCGLALGQSYRVFLDPSEQHKCLLSFKSGLGVWEWEKTSTTNRQNKN
jgi:hypothetical protein